MSRLHRFHSLLTISGLLLACMILMPATAVIAQDQSSKQDNSLDDISLRPIFVTIRTFQMTAPKGSFRELNDQTFKMSTESLSDYDQWMKSLKKIYPEFEVGLLRTDTRKVFRTSKPAILSLVKQADGRDIEVQLFGAQSVGDGVTPGTTLITEVGLHFPNAQANKPVTYAVNHLDVEHGKTYFFVAKQMRLSPDDYVRFVRPTATPESMQGKETFLLFAFSVDLDKTAQPVRLIDERQSLEFQNRATNKPVPEVPANLREAGLGGNVRVRVEISSEGKISNTNIHYSSFPEMNEKAIASAKEWEFPKTLFETDKNPITCFITFSFPAQPPARKASATSPAK